MRREPIPPSELDDDKVGMERACPEASILCLRFQHTLVFLIIDYRLLSASQKTKRKTAYCAHLIGSGERKEKVRNKPLSSKLPDRDCSRGFPIMGHWKWHRSISIFFKVQASFTPFSSVPSYPFCLAGKVYLSSQYLSKGERDISAISCDSNRIGRCNLFAAFPWM